MDLSNLSTENLIGTSLAGVGIAIIGIWKYLSEKRAPTGDNGDRIIPGITIADMKPIKGLADEQARTTAANERIAAAAEGILKILTDQAKDDAIEDEVERRVRQRIEDRRRRTAAR